MLYNTFFFILFTNEASYDLSAQSCVLEFTGPWHEGCCRTNENDWNIFSMIVFDYAVNCSKNH